MSSSQVGYIETLHYHTIIQCVSFLVAQYSCNLYYITQVQPATGHPPGQQQREDELLKEAVKDHLMDPAAKLVEAQNNNNNNNARIIS